VLDRPILRSGRHRPCLWQFYRDVAAGPFYNYNKTGKPSEATIENWWRQGMMGGAKAHYDGIVAFSQTDSTEDLKKINLPVLVMHSEDDQIVPYVAAGPLSAKLLKNGTLKTYKGFPHAHHAGGNNQRRPAGLPEGVRSGVRCRTPPVGGSGTRPRDLLAPPTIHSCLGSMGSIALIPTADDSPRAAAVH
jgi:Prolyl oligopeptidase family